MGRVFGVRKDGIEDVLCEEELLNKATKYTKRPVTVFAIKMESAFKVETIEGEMYGKKGDYLVWGVKGELYPVDAKIFDMTYDKRENKAE